MKYTEEETTVEEFLVRAFHYLKHNLELPEETRPKNPKKVRTDNRVIQIITDPQMFVDVYDVLEDEADYFGLEVATILDNAYKIKELVK